MCRSKRRLGAQSTGATLISDLSGAPWSCSRCPLSNWRCGGLVGNEYLFVLGEIHWHVRLYIVKNLHRYGKTTGISFIHSCQYFQLILFENEYCFLDYNIYKLIDRNMFFNK